MLAILFALIAGSYASDRGRELYVSHCLRCHGVTDDKMNGDWKAGSFLAGTYKFRSTKDGQAPTDQDLERTIREGFEGFGMPAFGELPPVDRASLVAYLKSLSPRFAETPAIIEIPSPPKPNPKEGRRLYQTLGCVNCHGKAGKGDGPMAEALIDDFGGKVTAADLTQPVMRGNTAEDIYRTLATGLNGGPMPAFEDESFLSPKEMKKPEDERKRLAARRRWQLAFYVWRKR